MTLETALKAASMQRMPTPNTTEGAPSAAMAAVGVMRTAGTAAPAAISSGVPRSCACGPGVPRNATLRTATNATSATHSVINLDERAVAEPFAILIVRMRPTLEPQIQHIVFSISAVCLQACDLLSENLWHRCASSKSWIFKALHPEASATPWDLTLRTEGIKREAVSWTQPNPLLVMITTWQGCKSKVGWRSVANPKLRKPFEVIKKRWA